MRTLLLFAAAAILSAQDVPQVSNAHSETRAFTGNLAAQLRSESPAWFGYAIKTARSNESCCWSDSNRGCWLESGSGFRSGDLRFNGPVHLEGYDSAALLFRVANNQIEKIRVFSMSCPLDAGGLAFIWLTGVPAEASLSELRDLIASNPSHNVADGAIFAISQHDDPQAVEILIQAAKRDASPHIRSQALFWLAQKAGKQAVGAITDAIRNDPDTEVKKKAVFALSQLPKEEGVPKLIEVARTQKNPEVRKQAFFWLGQSNDPRAVAFFEQILTK